MKITREVVLDLLPVYLSGDASAATRELVDEYLKGDPELAQRVRSQGTDAFPRVAPSLPPELELRSLVRTRGLLKWQKWLCALATAFTALSLTSEISFHDGRIEHFRFLIADYPGVFGTCLVVGIAGWVNYFMIRRRLRTSALS